MTEYKFTLNPFKNLGRNSVVYIILDKKTQKEIYKIFCVNSDEKKIFRNELKEFEKEGEINVKKHKNWISNFKEYGKYTKLNGEVIPIIEYEFSPNKENGKR